MSTPYDRPRITDPETVADWAEYEAASHAAAEQYATMPTATGHAATRLWEVEL